MAITPWMTSSDLIASVKRKILFPISQKTFTENDILAFANEEMFISQVPSVLQFHEEYFVTFKPIPLQNNISRYPIPDRAIGMKLRDVFWMDQNGNLFEMTRIEEHDKAFYQRNVGANQAVHKFYIEGNDIVLTPGVVSSPTGSLVPVFYLRPNQLVKNDQAATVSCFSQTIKINNSLIAPLDTINVDPSIYLSNSNGISSDIGGIYFTAVNSLGGTITDIEFNSTSSTLVTSVGHQLSTYQTVTISGSNCNPSIDGTYSVTVLDDDTFSIPIEISTSGSTGTFTCANQFMIGVDNASTASNLADAIGSVGIITSATASSDIVTLCFPNINTSVTPSNTVGFVVPQTTMGVVFEDLPTTYTDSETNETSDLFQNLVYIDFLQTKPGHRTYVYDVQIPAAGISGTTINLPIASLMVPTGTVNNSGDGSNTIQLTLANIQPGDYICLANTCIIPQIPPDLHNGLAERTAARILAALGDQQGLQASMTKIQEIEQRQGNLLDNRSEGTPQKVVNRHSPLRYGKFGTIRRV